MQVLVDTSVWSLALRRSAHRLNEGEAKRVTLLRDLIQDGRVRLIGPIRQELLSGFAKMHNLKSSGNNCGLSRMKP